MGDAHVEKSPERPRRRSDEGTDDHEGEKRREDRKRTSKFRFKSKSSSKSSRHTDSSSRHTSSRHHRDRDREREDRYADEEGLEVNLGRPRERDNAEEDFGAKSTTAHGEGGSAEKDGDHDDKESASSHRRHRSHHHRHNHHRRRHDEDRDGDDREREREPDKDDDNESHHRHKRRRHHHHRRRKRDDRAPRSPTPPNPHDPPPLDPDAAFRESLFDAMADDEGAAYWEAVYGQPIHIYNNHQTSAAADRDGLGEMDDEEYAAHVRQKMWEKTHEGLLEERRRREEARQRKEEEAGEAARLTREMERSLRRGEDRRRRKAWLDKWTAYLNSWEAWDGTSSGIAWPVAAAASPTTTATATAMEIDPAVVREFFVTSINPREVGETEYLARLKAERVRWHPDKIQQRLGGKVDDAVMRNVTAVFQVVDKLWSDARTSRVT